jgi:hypothetical protein
MANKKHVIISPEAIGVLSGEERKSLINIVDKLLVNGIELELKYDSIQNP